MLAPLLNPLLNDNWLNRVAFDPASHADHVESFFFKANDPARQRALWIKCTLFSSPGERCGEAWGLFFDGESGHHVAFKETLPLERVRIDPERSGLGVGECVAEEGATSGVVRGVSGALSWHMTLTDQLGPYRHLPADWMYDSPIAGTKLMSPHPCAIAHGELEIWEGVGRHSKLTRVSLDGWRAMQGHNWGKRHTERYAWAHCSAFSDGRDATFFEGFFARARVAGMPRQVTMARVVVDGRPFRFDRWRNIFNGSGSTTPTSWKLSLAGPDGTLEGELRGKRENTLGLVYRNPRGPAAHCLNSKLAELHLTVRPPSGAPIELTSTKAALEVTQLETDHGIPMVL